MASRRRGDRSLAAPAFWSSCDVANEAEAVFAAGRMGAIGVTPSEVVTAGPDKVETPAGPTSITWLEADATGPNAIAAASAHRIAAMLRPYMRRPLEAMPSR